MSEDNEHHIERLPEALARKYPDAYMVYEGDSVTYAGAEGHHAMAELLWNDKVQENERAHVPIKIISRVPEILNPVILPDHSRFEEIPTTEVVYMRDTIAVTEDGPAFSHLNKMFPEETTELYHEWRNIKAELVASSPVYRNFYELTSAGDEDIEAALIDETNPIAFMSFAVRSQIEFMKLLQSNSKYHKIAEELIKIKGGPAHISAGITHGTVCTALIELAGDPKGLEERQPGDMILVIRGRELTHGKGMMKGQFLRASSTTPSTKTDALRAIKTETDLNPISTDRPQMTLQERPEHLVIYREFIEEAGLVIEEPTDSSPYHTMRLPAFTDEHSVQLPTEVRLEHVIRELEKAADKLEDAALKLDRNDEYRRAIEQTTVSGAYNMHRVKNINLGGFRAACDKLTWRRMRGASRKSQAELVSKAKETNEEGRDGTYAFLNVDGMGEIGDKLQSAIGVLSKSQGYSDRKKDELSARMLMQAVRFTAFTMSKSTAQQGWSWENIELDDKDRMHFVINYNVLNKTGKSMTQHEPAFWALVDAMKSVQEDPEVFTRDLSEYLADVFSKEMKLGREELCEHIKANLGETSLVVNTGVAPAELNKNGVIGYYIDEEGLNVKYPVPAPFVGGKEPSHSARRSGLVAHGRAEKYISELEAKLANEGLTQEERLALSTWRHELPNLRNLYGKSCTVVPYELMEQLNIPENKCVVLQGVILKGMDPENLAVIPNEVLYGLLQQN